MEVQFQITKAKRLNQLTFGFRIYTSSSKGSGVASVFLHSTNPSYRQVYENNMNEQSFIGTTKGIAKVLANPKSAFLNIEDMITFTEEYQSCKIKFIPWRQFFGHMAMAVPKDSKFKRFFNWAILDLKQKGILDQSRKKWSVRETNCHNEVTAISPNKVVVAFIIVVCGMVFGLVVLLVERLLKAKKLEQEVKGKAKFHKEQFRVCLDQLRLYKNVLSEDTMKTVMKEIFEQLEANFTFDNQSQ